MVVFIIRMILFLIAISAIRGVVNYVGRFFRGITTPRQAPRPKEVPSTLLKMDPVCGTYVAIDSSFKKIAGGTVYHFCSEECRNRFAA